MEKNPNGHEPIRIATPEGSARPDSRSSGLSVAEAQNPPAPKTPDIRMIPQEELIVPDWNPRVFIDEQEMMNLLEYMRTGGHVSRIEVWKNNDQTHYAVISGQRRLLAARRLGWTHIEAEVMHITLEQAKKKAITSNQGVDVYWLDKYISWENFGREHEGHTQEQIAAELGVDSNWVSRQTRLMALLTPTAREAIRKSLKPMEMDPLKNKGNMGIVSSSDYPQKTLKNERSSNPKKGALTELVAYRLVQLWDKRSLAEAQELVTAALPVILAQHLSGPQVDALVAWVNSGQNIADFNVAAKTPKTKSPVHPVEGHPKPASNIGSSNGPTEALAQEEAATKTPAPKTSQTPVASSNLAEKPMGSLEVLGWDLLAGVSILKQLRQKVKEGHRPNFWEALALIALFLGEGAVSLWKHVGKPALRELGRLLKQGFHLAWKMTKESLKDMLKLFGRTFYKIAGVVLSLLILGFIAWLVYDTVVHHGFHPWAVLEEFADFIVQAVKFVWRVV